MLVDWFTVAVQVFNFLLLVWLLKKYLYGPVMRAMRGREERVALDLEQAEEARKRAAEERGLLIEERERIAEERERILLQARAEAATWREQAMERARKEVESQRETWLRALDEERESFSRELRTRVAQAAMRAGEAALDSLADDSLGERLVSKLLQELPQNGFTPPPLALVRMGFEPDEGLRETLRQGLRNHWQEVERVEFEYAPELGLGLVCILGDHRIQWTVARYMEGLWENVMSAFPRESALVASRASLETGETGGDEHDA